MNPREDREQRRSLPPTPEARQAEPTESTPADESALSRRHFLQAVGLSTAAAAIPDNGLVGDTAGAVRAGEEQWGPDRVPVTLKVNGETLRMRLQPRVTLLDALRDHIRVDTQEYADLTGSKRVCDRSSCGACTVLLDGQLVYACTVLAIEAQGHQITTIEGIGKPGDLHPVQEEFIKADGLQCGFCTPGFVMASVALLNDNKQPTREEIRRALDGNICRCGTQTRVIEAIENAASRMREGR